MSIHSEYAIIEDRMATPAPAKTRRTASRDARRRQLIDATMKCIARKGMGSTTLGDVAKEAGLSQGIVNLHFESKDNLLTETLRALAREYRDRFDKVLQTSGPDPADKLTAIVKHDFSPSICNQRTLAVWFAFWGEVQSRPTYRRLCDEWDRYYDDVVADLCTEIIEDGQYSNVDSNVIANAVASLTNGNWLSCLISPQTWSRKGALEITMSYLRGVFPKHFN
jgi:TetR/AcrR family transcriptional repressor of bet genes